MDSFNYIIVGAGLAGSTIAERIANILGKEVLLIEKRPHIGGNCYDYRNEKNILVHKYGPHLFHTDYKDVFEYLSNFTEWRPYKHRVLALINGKKVPLPFNFNSIETLFAPKIASNLITKLVKTYGEGKKVSVKELMNSQDKDLNFLGKFVFENVYKNYSKKQWGIDPLKLGDEVLSRVPISLGRDDRYFQDIFQVVPKDGYSKIFERMLFNKKIKLILNTDFKDIIKINIMEKKIYFDGKEFKGKLIFTARIDELFNFIFGELSYRTLDLKFKTLKMNYFQEVATVNYPNDYEFTRITEFKHIHPVDSEYTTILYEYPRECKASDIPFYPLFTQEEKEKYYKYLEIAEKFDNLFLVGRLAEFKYYDMDDVVKRALDTFEEKVR
uniref:UDP-galactopyranose mutase n=2 Tax=Bacteria TaxID=2 RepID=A0A7C2P6T2_UNCW3